MVLKKQTKFTISKGGNKQIERIYHFIDFDYLCATLLKINRVRAILFYKSTQKCEEESLLIFLSNLTTYQLHDNQRDIPRYSSKFRVCFSIFIFMLNTLVPGKQVNY